MSRSELQRACWSRLQIVLGVTAAAFGAGKSVGGVGGAECFALGAGVAAVPGSKVEPGAGASGAEELTPDKGAASGACEAFAGDRGGGDVGDVGAASRWLLVT